MPVKVLRQRIVGADALRAVTEWWNKGILLFLTASIVLLGFGRFNVSVSGAGISAWSISRTTFFFWLIGKILLWLSERPKNLGIKNFFPLPLLIFFAAVSLSLLPDFHEPADYRYFFFAVMHCVMVVDVFGSGQRSRFLLLLLGSVPGILVLRGIIHNPAVFDFALTNRFSYPLAHANPAGLLFSMSIPLALAIVVTQTGFIRRLTLGSLCAQFAGLVLTYSRGAWLASIISLFGLGSLEPSVRKAALALGLTSLVVFMAVAPLRNRLLSVLTPRGDIAIEGRVRFMTDAIIVGLERPFLGAGYGRDRLREGVRQDIPGAGQFGFIPHSHSLYTELLAGTGFVGLSAFLWMVGANIIRLIRKAQAETSPSVRIAYFCLSASLVAFLVGCLGDVPFYNHDTRIFFFTLLALSYLALRNDIVSRRQTNR